MEIDRWSEVKGLLADAMERHGSERASFLDTLEPDLRREVDALLQASGDTDGVLEHPLTAGPLADALEPWIQDDGSADPLIGATVGPYKISERVGRGGMGDVYRAKRADGLFDRQVALKMVRRGADTGAVLRRFAAERKILGRLQHPGIARLLGAGIDNGRPWLAMDFVEGIVLTEYARGASLDERVQLLIAVAEAVHTAHQSLVVHRDLKPSNVLVARGPSGKGQPMLLDFGIAKILDPEDDADLTLQDGHRPMTRTYAAPEQIRGEMPTTATDVYGLGLLLYEVLSGARPFPDTGHQTALEHAILHTDPQPPSESIAADGASGVTPEARSMRGDLDTICLKALRKEPSERYASAEALAADLRRYLSGQPIEARPPSARYRAEKFIQRNRTGVIATAVALLAAIVMTTVYAVSLTRERDRAQTEAETATQVADLMTRMFDRDPFAANEERIDTLTVRDFLTQRGAAAVRELNGQPRIQARLATLLSHLHTNLGELDTALPLARRAVALYDSLGIRDADTGQAYTALASVLSYLGEYSKSEAYYRSALAIAQESHPKGAPAIAEATSNLAYALDDLDTEQASQESIALGVQALKLSQEALGKEHIDVAQTHNNLGAYLYSAGRYDEAEVHYRQALSIRKKQLGDHPLVANTLSNLANLVKEQGEPEEAVSMFEEAIRIWRGSLGTEHPSLSAGLYGLSDSYREMGRFTDAEKALEGSLQIDRATLPPDHPYIADGLVALGNLQARSGRLTQGEVSYREAVSIYQSREDVVDHDLAIAEAALGKCLLRQGRYTESAVLLERALPHMEPEERPEVERNLAAARASRRS